MRFTCAIATASVLVVASAEKPSEFYGASVAPSSSISSPLSTSVKPSSYYGAQTWGHAYSSVPPPYPTIVTNSASSSVASAYKHIESILSSSATSSGYWHVSSSSTPLAPKYFSSSAMPSSSGPPLPEKYYRRQEYASSKSSLTSPSSSSTHAVYYEKTSSLPVSPVKSSSSAIYYKPKTSSSSVITSSSMLYYKPKASSSSVVKYASYALRDYGHGEVSSSGGALSYTSQVAYKAPVVEVKPSFVAVTATSSIWARVYFVPTSSAAPSTFIYRVAPSSSSTSPSPVYGAGYEKRAEEYGYDSSNAKASPTTAVWPNSNAYVDPPKATPTSSMVYAEPAKVPTSSPVYVEKAKPEPSSDVYAPGIDKESIYDGEDSYEAYSYSEKARRAGSLYGRVSTETRASRYQADMIIQMFE